MGSKNQNIYIYVSELLLNDGCFQQGGLVYGMPGITAIAGWVYRWQRQMLKVNLPVNDISFAWGVKDFSVTKGRSLHVCFDESDAHYQKNRIKFDPKGCMAFDLLLRVNVEQNSKADLKTFVHQRAFRLVNGNLFGGYYCQDTAATRIAIYDDLDAVETSIAEWCPRHYWVMDASKELEGRQVHGDRNDMDALDNLIGYLNEDYQFGPDFVARKPAVVGFYQLEQESPKTNVREELLHAHGEAILGAIRLMPRVARNKYKVQDVFWQCCWENKKWLCRGEV